MRGDILQLRHSSPSPTECGKDYRRLMPLATTQQLIASARATGCGIGAFNVITLEHAEAVIRGAEIADGPAIVQISENAVNYHYSNVRPLAAAVAELAAASTSDVSLHLDHVRDENLLHQAADAGFSSVMFDASTLGYADNVAATCAAADWAHANGVYLEAELGAVGGKGGAHTPGVRTNPAEAADYVAATGVDALAVAVGSSHAMVERTASLDYELIARLREAVTKPLVLHGSSGVSDEHLAQAIRAGIVKVNIGTILNVAYTRAVRAALSTDSSLVDPRKYIYAARDAMSDEAHRLITVIRGS